MTAEPQTTADHPLVIAFVQALAERDFETMKDCLAPDVSFRALLPGGVTDVDTNEEAAAVLDHWFSVYDRFRLVGWDTGWLGNMVRIGYRVEGFVDDGWWEVEQQAYCEPIDDRFVRVNLVCSGIYDRDPPDWA